MPGWKESHEQILLVVQELVSCEGHFCNRLKSSSNVCGCSRYISECLIIQRLFVKILGVLTQDFSDVNRSASRWHCRSTTKILLLPYPHIKDTNKKCRWYVQNNIILGSDRQYDHSYYRTTWIEATFTRQVRYFLQITGTHTGRSAQSRKCLAFALWSTSLLKCFWKSFCALHCALCGHHANYLLLAEDNRKLVSYRLLWYAERYVSFFASQRYFLYSTTNMNGCGLAV